MRAVRRSPLFRIALLSFAVLFAHSVRGNTQPIIPVRPVCPGKVAAAQPDPDKKLSPAARRIVTPGRFADWHNLFGATFRFTGAHAASLLFVDTAVQNAVTHRTTSISPQRRPFALRI